MPFADVGVALALGLVVVAFVGGIGMATIGPGGVFVTIALVTLTDYAPGTIAGTTSSALFGAGIVGTIAYRRSGELAGRTGRGIAITLSASSAVGAFAGSQLNALLSERAFGVVLAGFVIVVGLLIWYRERGGFDPVMTVDPESVAGRVAIAGIGLGVGVPSGLLGVGGPILAVPALVLVGVPLLTAVGASQLQAVFITGSAATGYLLRGTVSPELLAIIAPPLVVGVGVGWRIAHRVDADRLRRVLAVALLAVGIYLLA